MDRRKKLTNSSEHQVLNLLRDAADDHNAHLAIKLKFSDAVDINSSGISSEEFRYATLAHLDFVVTDPAMYVQFAVEFDGPDHITDVKTVKRDRLKNSLCERLGLPLVRVGYHSMRHVKKLQLIRWLTLLYFNPKAAYANLPFAEASQGLQTLIKQKKIFSDDGESPTAAIHSFASLMYDAWVFVCDRDRKLLYGNASFQRFPNFVGVDASQLAVSIAEYILWKQVESGMKFQYSVDDVATEIANRCQEAKRYEETLSSEGVDPLPNPEWTRLIKLSAASDDK